MANLILLIGTNPLPNLVVAKYLLSSKKHEYSTISLIYSEENNKQQGTKEFAENLSEILSKEYPSHKKKLVPLSDVSSSQKIYEDLNAYEWEKNDDYHLNYTGGTKTMAVHVHEFFKSKFDNNVEFSYLDARNYCLLYDSGKYEPVGGNLRNYVKVTIEELLKLHGYEINSDSFKNTTFDNVLDKFKKSIQEGSYKQFIEWYKNINHIKREKDIFKKANYFIDKLKQEFPINLKLIAERFGDGISEIAKEILDAFPEDKKIHIIDNEGQYKLWTPDENTTNSKFEEKVKYTWEYLDGKWLEHYTYSKLKNYLESKGLKENEDFGWSLKAQNKQGKDFELDIFIINGYQLIAISITTDAQTYICKSKGFEVIHRARQIGGDESIAILITALPQKNVEELQNDLHINTGTTEERFKVFGIDDWKDIEQQISYIINI